MTTKKTVSAIQNKWHDAQRVDKGDLDVEQAFNTHINSSVIENHFGSGVVLETPEQTVLFDSDNLDSTQAAILAAGNFDGIGLDAHEQPSDSTLGNQLEVSLTGSTVLGRFSTKVLIVGLSFEDELIYDKLTFRKNEKQITSKHYKQILTIMFNGFLGNNNCSRNHGGRITIKEALPYQLSRDALVVSQDVEPDLFFRDFKVASVSDTIFTAIQTGIGTEYNADDLKINITGKEPRVLVANDVSTYIGEKFLSKTTNLQKITLLLSVDRDSSAAIQNRYDWAGDLVVSLYKLQTSVNCPTDIVPELDIEYIPEQTPITEVSYSQAELLDLGYVLTDTPQPVDFVFNNTAVANSGGMEENTFYAIIIRRSGAASAGNINIHVGTNQGNNSRVTVFSSGAWVDVPEDDLWFQVWSDSAKIANGRAYDNGIGIDLTKTTVDTNTGAIIDNEKRFLSFKDTGKNTLNIGVVESTIEESVKVQDERTGNIVNARQQYVPTFSFVTESGLETLKSIQNPLINGCAVDGNPKNTDLLSGTQTYPGMVKGDTFCIVNPDPDLLSFSLIGRKIIPNKNCVGKAYRIFKAELCVDGYGDVNGDGYIDDADVQRASELIGEGIASTVTQQKIVDGSISTLELLRADVDGDGYVTASDVSIINQFVDRRIVGFPVGTSFTHMCLTVQQSTGRYDGYFDCDGYVRLDGGLTLTDPLTLDPYDLLYDGYLIEPSIDGSDSEFSLVPYGDLSYDIIYQPFWQDYLVSFSSNVKRVPSIFSYTEETSQTDCVTSKTFDCDNLVEVTPVCDPGRNDFYVPNNLIIGDGQVLRPDGSYYKHDLEIGTIILKLPQVPLTEASIDIFNKLIADRGDGFTGSGYPALRYADCTTVKKTDLALNKLKFDVSIQAFYPNLDGYSAEDGYGVIVDDIIGVHMDHASGVLTLSIKDMDEDPIFLTLVTKIQIMVYLKKGGWNNDVLVINSDKISGLISSSLSGTTVFAFGDSYTEGLRGTTGGWRAQMITADIAWQGPYTDVAGLLHAGVGGDTLSPDMINRFNTDWLGQESTEIWIEGGTNDIINAGVSADVAADRLSSLISTIYVSAPPFQIIRLQSLPPTNSAYDSTIDTYWRYKLAQIAATHRALGRRVYLHHTGGNLSTGDLDAISVEHPIDGTYGVSGYGLWAKKFDEWLDGSLMLEPNSVGAALAVHFKADTGYNPTTGVWTDQSGNGRDASPTGASKPTLITGPLGKTALSFASSPLRTGTAWTLSQPNTIAVVMDSINATGSPAIVDGGTTADRNLIQSASGTNFMSFFAGSSASDVDIKTNTIGHLYLCEFNGSVSKLFIDGNPRSQTLATGSQGLNGMTIGGSAAATPTNLLTAGNIYEICVWDGALSADDKFAVAHYFRSRYGLWPLLGETTSW